MVTSNVFALSDLHLSFEKPKPMDIFGSHWTDHPMKVSDAWKKQVGDQDIVVISGDVSWAMKLEGALKDLAFIDALPGHKVMIRGNHDYWYPKSAPRRNTLPSSIHALYHSSCVINGVAFVGCKGLSFEDADVADVAVHKKDLERQLKNLQISFAHLKDSKQEYSTIVALIHYPPAGPGKLTSPLTEILDDSGVSYCLYGHLHTEEDFALAIQGRVGKVHYTLTSADYLSFTPSLILSPNKYIQGRLK
jgi:hypothetical protein